MFRTASRYSMCVRNTNEQIYLPPRGQIVVPDNPGSYEYKVALESNLQDTGWSCCKLQVKVSYADTCRDRKHITSDSFQINSKFSEVAYEDVGGMPLPSSRIYIDIKYLWPHLNMLQLLETDIYFLPDIPVGSSSVSIFVTRHINLASIDDKNQMCLIYINYTQTLNIFVLLTLWDPWTDFCFPGASQTVTNYQGIISINSEMIMCHKNKAYYFNISTSLSENSSWLEAEKMCSKEGRSLLTLQSPYELDTILSMSHLLTLTNKMGGILLNSIIFIKTSNDNMVSHLNYPKHVFTFKQYPNCMLYYHLLLLFFRMAVSCTALSHGQHQVHYIDILTVQLVTLYNSFYHQL